MNNLTKKEKWKKIQELVSFFGAEIEKEKIILVQKKNDVSSIESIDRLKESIESMLEVTLQITIKKDKNRWEIKVKDFNK
ncbi:MAG: hypothetical protein HeimC3_35600 [Candidatus Heimdallarchaeota archaeon LC_3]|nr:MAG: hypothetical protein HeimC3_35600 [Candidatus Heimdallarchaeota archaeon LC_3]